MKKYTSKQEYAAFYWDGSNVEALQEWFNELGVAHNIELEECGQIQGLYYIVKYDGEQRGNLNPFAAWLVISTNFDIPLELYDVRDFNKYFVEVSE